MFFLFLLNRLLNLVEYGIVKFLLNKKLPNVEICPQNLGSTERQLRVGDLAMTYYIMIAGFATGIVIFFTEIIFKYINMKCCKNPQTIGHTLNGPIENIKNVMPFGTNNFTPPPPYTSIFNGYGRKLGTMGNIKKNQENSEIKGVRKIINGRDYMVYTGENGFNKLIPIRAPSATLFQYTYTNANE